MATFNFNYQNSCDGAISLKLVPALADDEIPNSKVSCPLVSLHSLCEHGLTFKLTDWLYRLPTKYKYMER